jgi:hypothetical protein
MPHGFSPAQATAFREKSRIGDIGFLILCEFGPSHRTGDDGKARPTNRVVCPFFVSHLFIGQTTDDSECHGVSRSSFTRTATDGSGHTITVTGYTSVVITGPTGELGQQEGFASCIQAQWWAT